MSRGVCDVHVIYVIRVIYVVGAVLPGFIRDNMHSVVSTIHVSGVISGLVIQDKTKKQVSQITG